MLRRQVLTQEQATESDLLGRIQIRSSELADKMAARAALDELLSRHYSWVLGVCRTELRHESDAYDAAQEVMVEIARSIRGFNGRSAFSTWVFTILRRVLGRIRKRKAKRKEEEFSEESGQSSSEPSPEIQLEHKQRAARIQNLLRELPEKQRYAIHFHYFEDLSVEETATRMSCSISSVKTHLLRGRKKLKILLDSE